MPRSKEVDAWLVRYDNPMKDVVQRMREIILSADPRIEECIKWQAPTFTYQGNLASFFPKSKQHASLMFHQGALIPGKHALFEGSGSTSRVVKLGSVAAANAAKRDLIAIVKAWCDWKAETSGTKSKVKAKAKIKTVAAPRKRAGTSAGKAGKQATGKRRATASRKAATRR